MAYTIEVRLLASLEILDAYDWYESQKEGLGTEFINEFDIFYDSLYTNPNVHSFYHKSVRQGTLNRFPFTVVYEVFDNVIIIYSVFMEKRNPVKKRLK